MKNGIINAYYIDSAGKTAERVNPDNLPQLKHENDYFCTSFRNFTGSRFK